VQEGQSQKPGSLMPNTVQYHPDANRLGPDGQGPSPVRLHNLPPKKSLSPSFIASHAASLEGAPQQIELTHTVQHLPTSHGKQQINIPQGQSSSERMQFAPDIRLIGQMMTRGPQQLGPQSNVYRQFAPPGLDQGGLLRQQLLQGGVRPGFDPPRSTASYNRPSIDSPKSTPSYPSPPPNRTVHNIPGASPPSIDRGRPKTENAMESDRTSPYHVSTIRKTPSPAPKHRVSPAPPPLQLSPHYRHDMVSPASSQGEKFGVKQDRPQLSMEETLKLIQGHPGINLPPHLLAQLTQQSVRTEQKDVMKVYIYSTVDRIGLVYDVQHHFQQYSSYIMAVSFIDGGNQSTRRKPLICCKSLTNFIT
jgi:hypothetical protein